MLRQYCNDSILFSFDFKDNKIRITYSQLKCPYPYTTYVYKKDGRERSNPQAKFVKKDVNEYLHNQLTYYKNCINNQLEGDNW